MYMVVMLDCVVSRHHSCVYFCNLLLCKHVDWIFALINNLVKSAIIVNNRQLRQLNIQSFSEYSNGKHQSNLSLECSLGRK